MIEKWKYIKGYETMYQVSTKGRVKSFKSGRGKILAQKPSKYLAVSLHTGTGKGTTKNVHRLVAENFLVNNDLDKEVNHINGDKLDNKLENLEWVTRSENHIHASKMRLKTSHFSRKDILDIRWLRSEGFSHKILADLWGVAQVTIYRIDHKESWGYIK